MNVDYENFTGTAFESAVEQNQIECSLNLSAEHYDKILSLSGTVGDENIKTEGQSTVFSGKAYFNALFQGEEVEKVEAGVRFEFKRELNDNLSVHWVDYGLDDLALKKDGGMLYVTAIITAKITYKRDEDVKYCASTDLLCKTESFTVDKVYPCRATYDVEDEFETVKLKKVLQTKADVSILSVKATENAILVDGDLLLSLVLLPFSENSDIVKERRTIPFRFEIECSSCAADMSAFCLGSVKGVSLKVYTDEETGKSQVSSVVQVGFVGGAVDGVERERVVDAFSESCDLNISTAVNDTLRFVGQKAFTEKIFGKMECDVPEYSRFIRFIGEDIEISDYTLENGELYISGLIFGNGIFSGEGGIVSRRASLAFEIKREVDCSYITCLSVCLDGAFIKQRSGALEGDFAVKVNYLEYRKSSVYTVSQIDDGEQKSVNKSVITVYLGKKGDDEWDVVKALSEPIESIRAFNPQLEFPLLGGEKIMIFRRR